MARKWIFPALFLLAFTFAPGLLRAQGNGPGPGFGPGPGGPRPFGRGFGGRVLGVEGCVNAGWHVPAGTPGYAAQITRTRVEPVLNGAPVTHTTTETSYRDNSGVSYQQLTLPAFGNSGTPRTVICIDDPNLHIRLVVNPANLTAREFQLPQRTPPANAPTPGAFPPPPRPQGQNPNITISHPSAPSVLNSEISTYCTDATTIQIVRGSGPNAVTSERVFCPSLRLELYSSNAGPRGDSTTTATITATGSGVNLASLPVPYPLPSNYAVTVVTPGSRRNRSFNGGNGGAAPSSQSAPPAQ